MTAIFFKELRENAKWAIVIGVAFLVMILLRMWHSGAYFLLNLPEPLTLVYAPLAGLAMGFAQSAFETRADNWAFVVHRPVARAGIFGAKCAAGLVLLYAALGIPCALAAGWAGQKGNLAMPFQGRMLLPLVADVLTAGCYYFAGVVLTLRKARWFGTRLLPVGMAFVCSVVVRLAPEFWQAVAVIAVCQCVGAMAAWSVFATNGAVEGRGAGKAGLGAMIYVGALTIGFLLSAVLGIFESTVIWRDVRMSPDGQVVRTIKTYRDGELSYVVTDLTGKPLAEYEGINLDDPADAERFARFVDVIEDDRHLPWPMSTMVGGGYRSARAGIRGLRTFGRPGARMTASPLFNVHDRIVDLYDPTTCRLIGTVGPAGFSAGEAEPVGRFPGEPLDAMTQASTRTLTFASGVYWMELDQRRVRKVFEPAADDPVVGAHELLPQTNPTILVATWGRLYLLNASGEKLMSMPLEVNLSRYGVRAARLSNGNLVLRAAALSPDLEEECPTEFLEYGTDGKRLRKTTAPEIEESDDVTVARTAAFGLVHPLAGIPLHRAWLIDSVFQLDAQHHEKLFFLCAIVGGLLAAAGTMLLSRRYGFAVSKSAAWTIGNLLIGPAGVVVMVGLNEWPVKQAAVVEADGREIFEPIDAIVPAA